MLEQLITITLDKKTPFIASALYVLYTIYMNKKLNKVKGPFLQRNLLSKITFFMVSYNALMSFVSFMLFKNLFFTLERFYKEFGFMHLLQDPNHLLRKKTELHVWSFYITKYIEIIDTVILHVNHRKTTFLQSYHHTGAIICCWMLCVSNSHLSCIFVAFNTFVHTFMYTYYIAISLRISIKFKKLITYMQIIQFILGSLIFLSIITLTDVFSRDTNIRKFQYITTVSVLLYVFGLIILFRSFINTRYSSNKANKIK